MVELEATRVVLERDGALVVRYALPPQALLLEPLLLAAAVALLVAAALRCGRAPIAAGSGEGHGGASPAPRK